MKGFVLLAVLLCVVSYASAFNVSVTARSGSLLPVANVSVMFYNISGVVDASGLTDLKGNFTAFDLSGGYYLVSVDLPSSAYSARIDSINGSAKVFLNDVLGVSVRLVNTLGQPLEAQDCSVAIFRNDSGSLVRAYDTSCRQGERYIDSAGNWASITNCPLTDSNGHYFFSTRIVEGDGFEYGRNYTVMVTCNAQSARETFMVDVMKPPDTDMALDFIVRYGG